jgi:signal transduction histidine kinase/CheY-like chemotaxis protein
MDSADPFMLAVPDGPFGPEGFGGFANGILFPLDPYPALMLICAVFSLFLCARIISGTKRMLAQGVGLYLAAAFLLSMFKFAEFILASPEGKFGALRMQWLGIAFLPCSFLIIAMAFENKPLKGVSLGAVLFPSAAAVVLVWTNHLHYFFWGNDVRFIPPWEYSTALGYWLFSACAFIQIGVAFFIMVRTMLRARGLTRRWMKRLVVILFLPAAGNAIFVLAFKEGMHIDPTPFLFAFSGLLMVWTLRSFDIFEALPYAKGVLLESIDSPIVVVDYEDLVVGENEEAKRLSPDGRALNGRAISEIVPLLSEKIEIGERRLWSRDGIEYMISCYETKKTHSQWRSRILLFRDVTNLSKAKREAEEAQARAEAANAAKSAFIATVSHEIRNPLNAVIGLIDLNLQASLPQSLRDDLEVVQSSGNVILGLVNDLLDLAKIESGKMELESADFDLHDKVLSIMRAFRPVAEKKGISLDLSIDDGTPRYVRGDSLRYGQVLMNLVSNAIKFTEHGAVSVTVSPIADAQPRDSRDARSLEVGVAVSDTGIGISQERLSSLFRDFSQADPSISRRFGGTGLGLSICKKLVELFGGEIDVSSVPGAGSVFSYTARFEPAAAVGSEVEAAASRESSGAASLRVLVVDDDLVNATVARRYIKRLGHDSLIAATGAEAIELAAKERPDLVLLDLGLPDMDGFEACRRLRGGMGDGDKILIVAMTARVDLGMRADCASAGMIGCLAKPIDPVGLERILGRAAIETRDFDSRVASSVRTPSAAMPASVSVREEAPPDAPLVDLPTLLDRNDGDSAFSRELLGIFLSEAPEKREALRAALRAMDFAALYRHAHRLKGAALTLCALPLAAAAGKLEAAGREADRAGPAAAGESVRGSIEALAAELADCYERTLEAVGLELRSRGGVGL